MNTKLTSRKVAIVTGSATGVLSRDSSQSGVAVMPNCTAGAK